MPPWCLADSHPEDLRFEIIRALSDPSTSSTDTSPLDTASATPDITLHLLLPTGETHFDIPEEHTHITPEGFNSEPGYITCAGSPTDSGTSPAFTTSPFDTSLSCNVTPFDPSTLADRLDIADLGQSFINIPNPSDCTFPLRSAYWTPFNTMMTPAATSSLQEPPVAPKPEGAPDGIPPTVPTTVQLIELIGHFVAQTANQPAHELQMLEMPAKGHSAAPKFDDKPANLESYLTELEYQFDRSHHKHV